MSMRALPERGSKRRKLSHSSDDMSGVDMPSGHSSDSEQPNPANTSQPAPEAARVEQPIRRHPQPKSMMPAIGFQNSTASSAASTMALQVRELIDQIKPDYDSNMRQKQPLLDRIIEVLKTAPVRTPLPLSQAEKSLKKDNVSVPFVKFRPDADVKYKFEFQPPTQVQICGLSPLRIASKDHEEVEIVAQIPASLFQEKDYLNHRAFQRRAYYIACLGAAMAKNLGSDYELQYCLRDGNDLLPIIVVSDTVRSDWRQMRVVVDTVFPYGFWHAEKTAPERNCVRSASLDEDLAPMSTPFYNSTLQSSAATLQCQKIISDASKRCAAFSDGCLLGQVWLQQRGLDSTVSGGGFGLYEWALVVASFLVGGGIKGHALFSEKYSSVQLFKAMLQVLSTCDFVTQPMIINGGTITPSSLGQPLLYDSTMGINILYKMNGGYYEMLRHYASLSLSAINSRGRDNFQPVFIQKVCDPVLLFDELYTIDMSSAQNQRLDLATDLYKILRRGLGDRVKFLVVTTAGARPWKLTKSSPVTKSQLVTIGLVVNADAVARTVDHGPTAEEQEEARDFRQFWGEKSELRRFKDGRITETLVWSSAIPITFQIIQYLALFHLKIPPSSFQSQTSDFSAEYLHSSAPISTADSFKLINTKYQELASKLHQLDGMPLAIRSISPAHHALRYASQRHPLTTKTAEPIGVLVQFDSSSRWPDHLPAIQYTKIAFLAKLADLITADDSSLTTRLGIENEQSSTNGYYNTSFLDIVYPASGSMPLIFRLRIHHDREQYLLEEGLSTKAVSSSLRETLSSALLSHKRDFLASPQHTTTVRNLITQFPPLSTTIRLLKFWSSSHNLTNHLPQPILEIIAAKVFLDPAPWSAPGSSSTAFLRCLQFLAQWDWASTPLIIDLSLSHDMSASAHSALDTRFQAWRKLDPNMNTVAWFIGTNIDNTGTIWTQGARPARVVAGRVTALSRATIAFIREKESSRVEMTNQDWKTIFTSSLGDFDFVINLKSSIVSRRSDKQQKNKRTFEFKNLQVHEDLDTDKIGHDIVGLYVADLERVFRTSVLFFHGEGSRHIAGLWRPNILGLKEWRVRLGYSTTPVVSKNHGDGHQDSQAMCEINQNGILAEIAALGEGMIDKITVRDQ